jgi:hypothetical protein
MDVLNSYDANSDMYVGVEDFFETDHYVCWSWICDFDDNGAVDLCEIE